MKKRFVSEWAKDKKLEGLLFFSQRVNELLFDYTLDTYKFSALNTCFLIEELLRTINYIENVTIDKKHLENIVAELNWSFRKDIVAKSLLGNYANEYFPLRDIDNLNHLKLIGEILHNKISPIRYLNKCLELLRKSIKEIKKIDIHSLSSYFITTLINIGYHQNYLFYHSINHFNNPINIIEGMESLDAYFKLFQPEYKKYKVIFRCSDLLREINDSCSTFDLKLEENIALIDQKNKAFTENKSENELFVICNEIEAMDLFSAKQKAEQLINRVISLFSYFHHKNIPKWSDDVLVIHNDVNEYHVRQIVSPMVKTSDSKPKDAAKNFKGLLEKNYFDRRSNRKFYRAVDLHGQAVSSKIVENQLLHTWIAFETLIDGDENVSRIQQITDSVLPFVNLMYLRRIFTYIYDSIKRWNVKFCKEILNRIPDDVVDKEDPVSKIALIVTSDLYSEIRTELYRKLNDFPLLKFRIWQLHESLKTGKKIKEFIDQHTEKVSWHIRRIYRTRNLIVHEGTIDKNINILTENVHTYFDNFTHGLLVLSALQEDVNSINQGVKEGKLLFHYWQRKLVENEEGKCDSKNFKLLLFGE